MARRANFVAFDVFLVAGEGRICGVGGLGK